MSNLFVLPKVHTQSREINQIQQNVESQINKALQPLQDATDSANIIGEQKMAYLTESQFQAQAGDNWWICDGRSSIGTQYQRLTGNTVIPNASVTMPGMAVSFFIKVN